MPDAVSIPDAARKPFGELTKGQSDERRARVDEIRQQVEWEHESANATAFPAAVDAGAEALYDSAEHLRHGGRGWDDTDPGVRAAHRGMARRVLAAASKPIPCPNCAGEGNVRRSTLNPSTKPLVDCWPCPICESGVLYVLIQREGN